MGVLGELFLTAGVLVFLFIGWQLWFNELVVGGQQRDSALELSESWATEAPAASEEPADEPGDEVEPGEADAASPVDFGAPVSTITTKEGKGFATLYVPRFGADYVRAIGEGVDLGSVLNNSKLGVGHYEETQLPGQVGNFALAAHRTTWGRPFNQVAELQLGDKIYVQTADGWYVYAFRTLEYVRPTGVDVLAPVPQAPGVDPQDSIITLTSCNPMFSAAERIIAYGVLESWQPASAGMPSELAELQGKDA